MKRAFLVLFAVFFGASALPSFFRRIWARWRCTSL